MEGDVFDLDFRTVKTVEGIFVARTFRGALSQRTTKCFCVYCAMKIYEYRGSTARMEEMAVWG